MPEQEYLRRAIQVHSLTGGEIAKKAGIHHSVVGRLMRSESQISQENREKIYATNLFERPTGAQLEEIKKEMEETTNAASQVESLPVRILSSHPLNKEIYGDEADEDLVESIREKGILSPLLITFENLVVSGNRRLDAAKKAGLSEVPCLRVLGTPSEIEEKLILANRQRVKTKLQIVREYEHLKRIEKAKAGQRIQAGKKDPRENFPQGRASDLAAAQLGISGKTAEKMVAVTEEVSRLGEAGEKEKAEKLAARLEKSVDGAYQQVRPAPFKPEPVPEVSDQEYTKQRAQLEEKNREQREQILFLTRENQDIKNDRDALRARVLELEARLEALLQAKPEPEPEPGPGPEKLKVEKVTFSVEHNQYKGSRKGWAAIVELSQGGNVLRDSRTFLNPVATAKGSGGRIEKEYEETLTPGTFIELSDNGNRKICRVSEKGLLTLEEYEKNEKESEAKKVQEFEFAGKTLRVAKED